jgi:hypothetical protein
VINKKDNDVTKNSLFVLRNQSLLHEDQNGELKKTENTEKIDINCNEGKSNTVLSTHIVNNKGSNAEGDVSSIGISRKPIDIDMNNVNDNDYVNVKGDKGDTNDWVEVNDNNDKVDTT